MPTWAVTIMDAETLSSLYTEAILGVPKERSRFRGEPDFDQLWDEAVEWVERVRREHPDAGIDLPS